MGAMQMNLHSFKVQKKKNFFEKLIKENALGTFYKTPFGVSLVSAEKDYKNAVFNRDLKYLALPIAVAIFCGCAFLGIAEENHLLKSLGFIASGISLYFGVKEISRYESETGIGKSTTHTKIIEEKLSEYERQLDDCIEVVKKMKEQEKKQIEK